MPCSQGTLIGRPSGFMACSRWRTVVAAQLGENDNQADRHPGKEPDGKRERVAVAEWLHRNVKHPSTSAYASSNTARGTRGPLAPRNSSAAPKRRPTFAAVTLARKESPATRTSVPQGIVAITIRSGGAEGVGDETSLPAGLYTGTPGGTCACTGATARMLARVKLAKTRFTANTLALDCKQSNGSQDERHGPPGPGKRQHCPIG